MEPGRLRIVAYVNLATTEVFLGNLVGAQEDVLRGIALGDSGVHTRWVLQYIYEVAAKRGDCSTQKDEP